MGNLSFKNGKLMLDGKVFRIFSGAMHYFRIHPDLWKDRLEKLKACGLNTVETYVPWNLHEPTQGKFNFSGFCDIERYIKIAGELGLRVIVRPGPYICSEWDFGGLPSWLLNLEGVRLRCNNKPYLMAVERFYNELLPRVKALQSSNGGPVIAMQIENEYGSYGNDKEYLLCLKKIMEDNGINAMFFTSDGGTDLMLEGGTLDTIWKTVNFGTEAETNLNCLRKHQADLPLMCTEFWGGQGIKWGVSHRLRDPKNVGKCLREILDAGSHLNIYMFHGGTNFGFMNGAFLLSSKNYQPFVTSYDTDALLDEAGDPTQKYYEFRKIIAEYNPDFNPETPVPSPSFKHAYGEVKLSGCAPLFRNLDKISDGCYKSATPDTMETFGQDYGFILYRTRIAGPKDNIKLSVCEPRDRAMVFIDGVPIAAFYRNDEIHETTLSVPAEGVTLDILVENMGRINFGPFLEDNRKGISVGVKINYQYHFGWEIYTLPLKDLSKLNYSKIEKDCSYPAFFRGEFDVDKTADTFLKLPFGNKGVCWINGFNLGRYWNSSGPQFTLYVPAPLLKKGRNRIEIFELEMFNEYSVYFTDKAEL